MPAAARVPRMNPSGGAFIVDKGGAVHMLARAARDESGGVIGGAGPGERTFKRAGKNTGLILDLRTNRVCNQV